MMLANRFGICDANWETGHSGAVRGIILAVTETEPMRLSAEEVRVIDAQYQPFAAFATWAHAVLPAGMWDATLSLLAERKASAPAGAFDELVEESLRAAAIDTGAIEGLYAVDRGFTFSVISMASAWVAEIEQQKGSDTAALVRAQRKAYDLALDAATGVKPMSEMWIRTFHQVVCAAQATYTVRTEHGIQRHELPKGTYKKHPNHVRQADGSTHAFAPVAETPSEMHRLVQELRSEDFIAAHPVIQAAYAHYALTAIHPFADGNGRVARVLASVYFLRSLSIPFVLYADQKAAYLDALAAADGGQHDAFVYFVLSQMVDVQRDLAERLAVASIPSVEASLSRVSDAFGSHGGLTPAEMDLAGQRLLEETRNELQLRLNRLTLPPGIERQRWVAVAGDTNIGYSGLSGQPGEGFILLATSPVSVRVEELLYVQVATHPNESSSPFRIKRLFHPDVLDVRFDEIHPVVTEALRRRISSWVERVVRKALEEFASSAEKAVTPD
jgi:Fic family protein